MPLNDIVNVQITRQTQSVSEAGFGTLMILGTNKRFNDLIRYYSSMQSVAEDFSPEDDEYVAAQAVFSQPITPDQIAIGRRQANDATIEVVTAMDNKEYTVTVNGQAYTLDNSTSEALESTLTLDADFVADNLIRVQLNGDEVGDSKSVIQFDIDFVALNSILATVNGVGLTPVVFSVDQATTIAALAAEIATADNVVSATVTDTREITVEFDSAGNFVTSVVTTLGATQPTATIVEGGFFFDTDQETTMQNIADALELMPTVESAVVSADGANPDRVITITTKVNQDSVITLFSVNLGVSQPGYVITDNVQPTSVESIANALVQEINGTQSVTVTQSTALITGNSTVVTLNGSALAPVVYSVSNANTLTAIAALIAAQPNIDAAVSNGTNAITITPSDGFGVEASFVTTLGASQPTWTSVYAQEINAIDNEDGTFTLEATVPGKPFTLSVSTNIVNANKGRVTIEEANPNTLYQITLNGTLIQYTTSVEIQTNEQIAAALVALINAAQDLTVTAQDNLDGTFELLSEDLSLTFKCQITPVLMTYQFGMIIEPLVPSNSVVVDLDAIQAVDDNWYALALIERTSGAVQLAAGWIETQVKIFGTASADPNIIDEPVGTDTTSIAAILNNLGYVRTFVLYHQDANSDFPECAWFGNCLPLQPGSETWAFKQLASMATSDLSNNQSLNARNKEANTFEYIGGVGITQDGTMAQGEYIDIIRGVDWLTSKIQTYVYSILVNSPKIPYTDAGITAVEAQVKRALNEGISNNFIAADPEPEVTVPKAANVSSADKSARILRNVRFQATLAGAIQAVRIQGTVSV
jgi:hypothetical protein